MKECINCQHGCGGGSDVYCTLGLPYETYMPTQDTTCPYYTQQQHHSKPVIYEIWEIQKHDKLGLQTDEKKLGTYKNKKTAQKLFRKLINKKYELRELELDG